MSNTFETDDLAALAVMLSPPRLSNLEQLSGSTATAIELHQETLRLGSALMTVIGTLEIALRNHVCENLAGYFGQPWWMTNPPHPFQWREMEKKKIAQALDNARRSEYAKLTQSEKAHLDTLAFPNGRPSGMLHRNKVKARRDHIQVSEGKVVAEITFHFWKRIYSPDYDHSLWRTTLKKTFPNRKLKRAEIADKLEHVYQARNRLAHHEPVLHRRFDDTVAAIQFISERLGELKPGPHAPLAKLIAPDLDRVISKAAKLHARLDAYRKPPAVPMTGPSTAL